MNPRNRTFAAAFSGLALAITAITALTLTTALHAAHARTEESSGKKFVQIAAKDKFERSRIADLGISIEAVRSDSVWGIAHEGALERLKQSGFPLLGTYDIELARGGHQGILDFPPEDSRFHNYKETLAALRDLTSKNADIASLSSIGKTIEGRDIWAIHINTTPDAHRTGTSNKPGVIYMGNHHAREHVSAEVPLMFAQHLLTNRRDPKLEPLLDARDIWIIPMVNPDGVEFDISTTKYKWWRKNRRDNGDGTFGVDLNRNYGYRWGTGGSDTDTNSEVYMGKAPFSEPESQAIRDFVSSKVNTKVLLSFHTFSELILYPWGSTHDPIGNNRDRQVFEKMARTMAQWNKYTPQQSSDLYIASGDTTDWAYGERGIFAFTFELSPKDMWGGGFYPGQGMIDKIFQDNLRPCLYLLEVSDDPYKVLDNVPTGFLRNYVEPALQTRF